MFVLSMQEYPTVTLDKQKASVKDALFVNILR